MFESKSGVFLVAGLFFFALAFLANAVVPWVMYANVPEQTVEEMIAKQVNNSKRSQTVVTYFEDLADRYPEAFAKYYGEPPARPKVDEKADAAALEAAAEARVARQQWLEKKCAEALRLGRDVYVGEACWHCHSQFVRPVSNEEQRYGPVSKSWEYQNELQRPVLFGTRRVGPDLCREGGKRGNDWHAVHFYKPRLTSPESVMPDYPWFFDGGVGNSPGTPNRRGIAIITYMQFLGSWLDNFPHYHGGDVSRERGEPR